MTSSKVVSNLIYEVTITEILLFSECLTAILSLFEQYEITSDDIF